MILSGHETNEQTLPTVFTYMSPVKQQASQEHMNKPWGEKEQTKIFQENRAKQRADTAIPIFKKAAFNPKLSKEKKKAFSYWWREQSIKRI